MKFKKPFNHNVHIEPLNNNTIGVNIECVRFSYLNTDGGRRVLVNDLLE